MVVPPPLRRLLRNLDPFLPAGVLPTMPTPPESWKTRIDDLEKQIAFLEALSQKQTKAITDGALVHFALSESIDSVIRETQERDIQLAEHIADIADKLLEVVDRVLALESSNVDWKGATVQ